MLFKADLLSKWIVKTILFQKSPLDNPDIKEKIKEYVRSHANNRGEIVMIKLLNVNVECG